MGCLILQPFAARENQTYPNFWPIIDGPWYFAYKNPIDTIELLCLVNMMMVEDE
jgi:hypothetical protein